MKQKLSLHLLWMTHHLSPPISEAAVMDTKSCGWKTMISIYPSSHAHLPTYFSLFLLTYSCTTYILYIKLYIKIYVVMKNT